jgi:LPXTG-motif cell wall-anchored protein
VSKQLAGCFSAAAAITSNQVQTSAGGSGTQPAAAGTPNTSASLPSLRVAGIATVGVVGLVMLVRRRRRRDL